MSKGKYAVRFCSYCGKETKMEMIGELGIPEQVGQATRAWYRCSKCRHSFLFDLETLKKDRQGVTEKLDVKNCTPYSPEKTYSIGEAIYHVDWEDVGKVKGKEKTSNGGQAIVVNFEKSGERRLVENLKLAEPPAIPATEGENQTTIQSAS